MSDCSYKKRCETYLVALFVESDSLGYNSRLEKTSYKSGTILTKTTNDFKTDYILLLSYYKTDEMNESR